MKSKKKAPEQEPSRPASSIQMLLAQWYQTVKNLAASDKHLLDGAVKIQEGIQEMQYALVDPNSAEVKRKDRLERESRDKQEKTKAIAAINRAVKHLRDWQHRLEEDGYTGMSAEIEGVASDLSTPACLLGGKAAYTVNFRDVMHDASSAKWKLEGVGE